jgi:hypothetical protein
LKGKLVEIGLDPETIDMATLRALGTERGLEAARIG